MRTMLLFIALLLPTMARAQSTGSVTGMIVDSAGPPVGGVLVRVLGTVRGAVTRPDGRFVIDGLQPGNYEIRITDRYTESIRRADISIDSGRTTDIGVVVISSWEQYMLRQRERARRLYDSVVTFQDSLPMSHFWSPTLARLLESDHDCEVLGVAWGSSPTVNALQQPTFDRYDDSIWTYLGCQQENGSRNWISICHTRGRFDFCETEWTDAGARSSYLLFDTLSHLLAASYGSPDSTYHGKIEQPEEERMVHCWHLPSGVVVEVIHRKKLWWAAHDNSPNTRPFVVAVVISCKD